MISHPPSKTPPADPTAAWEDLLIARSFYIGEQTEAHRVRVRETYRNFAMAMGLDEQQAAIACRRLDQVNGWSQAASDPIGAVA